MDRATTEVSDRRWTTALAEHDAAVRGFLTICERVAEDDWQRPPAPGKWTPAAVALHLCQSYELGGDVRPDAPGMRMKVTPSRATVLRTFLLPFIVATSRFPRVKAPREVAPDAVESGKLTREAAVARLRRAATDAGNALRRAAAENPSLRLTHAYFGPLPPYVLVRLLSAHTRHHTRGLARSG
jgi:hypothetical protein